MFEVGFSELCMVGLVALIAIGPDKLPQIARVAGFWLGKSQRVVAKLKTELHTELYQAELQQLLAQQQNQDLQNLIEETESALQDINSSALALVQETEILPAAKTELESSTTG